MQAPNGTRVTGPLFGGTGSVGGAWYEGSDFPAPFRRVYCHADTGGEWIKAFGFDASDSPSTVHDFLANGGPISALATDPATRDLYYITWISGSEVRRLSYASTVSPPAAPAVSTAVAPGAGAPAAAVPAIVKAPPAARPGRPARPLPVGTTATASVMVATA